MSKKANPSLTAVYAGTFDPITNGHIDIIQRALKVFPNVTVAVAASTPKQTLFSVEERVEMVTVACKGFAPGLQVAALSGLLIDYVRAQEAKVIIRGLRAVSDFEYEAQMATINGQLAPDIETVFFMASANVSFVSSKIVKEVAKHRGDIRSLVPAVVAERLSRVF